MKLDLVFLPPWNIFTGPYLALGELAGFLRTRNVDVNLFDANIICLRRLLTTEALDASVQRIHALLAASATDCEAERKKRRKLQAALALYPVVKKHLPDACDFFDNRDHNNLQLLSFYYNIFEFTARIHTAVTYPYGFRVRDARLIMPPAIVHDFKAMVEAGTRAVTSFDEPLQEDVLPRLHHKQGTPVGLSVVFSGQIIPAVKLAAMIKKEAPGTPVIAGGPLWIYVLKELREIPQLFKLFDYIVCGEGEYPLYELLEQLEKGQTVGPIAGVVTGSPNEVSTVTRQLAVPDFVTPDFQGLDLSLYYNRTPVLPYLIGRGCYYNKCAFCSQSSSYGQGYRHREIDQILTDMRKFRSLYGIEGVEFIDETIPVPLLRSLARGLSRERLDILWIALTRAEPAFRKEDFSLLYESGCRLLSIGMESGSPRMIARMQKGIDLDWAEKLIRWAHEAGIWINNFFIFGFPGETEEDIQLTLAFLTRNQEYIDSISFGKFYLQRNSPIYNDPQRFGITLVTDNTDQVFNIAWEADEGLAPATMKNIVNMLNDKLKIFSFYPGHIHIMGNLLRVLKEKSCREIRELHAQRASRHQQAVSLMETRKGIFKWAEDIIWCPSAIPDNHIRYGIRPAVHDAVLRLPEKLFAGIAAGLDLERLDALCDGDNDARFMVLEFIRSNFLVPSLQTSLQASSEHCGRDPEVVETAEALLAVLPAELMIVGLRQAGFPEGSVSSRTRFYPLDPLKAATYRLVAENGASVILKEGYVHEAILLSVLNSVFPEYSPQLYCAEILPDRIGRSGARATLLMHDLGERNDLPVNRGNLFTSASASADGTDYSLYMKIFEYAATFLAHIHGYFWNNREILAGRIGLTDIFEPGPGTPYACAIWGREQPSDFWGIAPEYLTVVENGYKRLEEAIGILKQFPPTLVHYDINEKNIFWRADLPEKLWLLDWGKAKTGPFVLDIVFFPEQVQAVYFQALTEVLGYSITASEKKDLLVAASIFRRLELMYYLAEARRQHIDLEISYEQIMDVNLAELARCLKQ